MKQFCDWCEEEAKDFVEVGNDYVCLGCAKDLRPVAECPTRIYNVAEKFGYSGGNQ
jgi:hypothetical protein